MIKELVAHGARGHEEEEEKEGRRRKKKKKEKQEVEEDRVVEEESAAEEWRDLADMQKLEEEEPRDDGHQTTRSRDTHEALNCQMEVIFQ